MSARPLDFEKVIDGVLAKEQGFVDNPADRGGPTRWGITQATARANGYTGLMQELPLALAREIYRRRYISEPRFDQVADLSEAIASELIDTGVNMGPARASEFLQRWLNAFNAEGSRYADLFVDGRIGPVTLNALQAFLRWRGKQGEAVMVKALNHIQGARYLEIAENDPDQEAFVYGQILNRT